MEGGLCVFLSITAHLSSIFKFLFFSFSKILISIIKNNERKKGLLKMVSFLNSKKKKKIRGEGFLKKKAKKRGSKRRSKKVFLGQILLKILVLCICSDLVLLLQFDHFWLLFFFFFFSFLEIQILCCFSILSNVVKTKLAVESIRSWVFQFKFDLFFNMPVNPITV